MRSEKYLIYKFVLAEVSNIAHYAKVEIRDSTAPIDSIRWQTENLARDAVRELTEPVAPGTGSKVVIQAYRLDTDKGKLIEIPQGTFSVPRPVRDYLYDEFVVEAKKRMASIDPAFHHKLITLARESKTNYCEALEEIDRLVIVYQIGRE